MGVGSNQTGYDRPSSAVVYIYNEHIWKYTDFPNSQAFYGEYEDTPDLGSYLFDLTNDPYETTNLFPIVGHIHEPIISRNLSRTDIIWNALQYGLTLIEKMYADGVPSPIDYANPPRMHINLIPNQYGCWIPPDSPYSDIDCGLGNQVHDMSTKEYMPSMMEMVIKRTNKIYST